MNYKGVNNSFILFIFPLILNSKLIIMLKKNLTYAEIEILQHVLRLYISEYKAEMGKSYQDTLESLKLTLIVLRAQLENKGE